MRRKNFWDFVSLSIMAIILAMMLNSVNAQASVVGKNLNGYYPHMAKVTKVVSTKKRGIYKVTAKDANGYIWRWYDDAPDWYRGDFVAFIMNDNGTKRIYDDKVVDARYVGVKKFF